MVVVGITPKANKTAPPGMQNATPEEDQPIYKGVYFSLE